MRFSSLTWVSKKALRAGLGAHRATAQALMDAYAAGAEAIAAQLGTSALEDLLAAHRLWIDWLEEGRVRKLALVAERA